jgi:CubicO group peptidase (beta-lactamase class C family)
VDASRSDRFRSSRLPRRAFIVQGGRTALGVLLLPLSACSRPPQAASTSADDAALAALITELEAQIPSLLAAAQVPGLSIAIIRNAQVAWSRGFGVTSSATPKPVVTDTVFEAGSVSKTVFAYAVMKLSERGILGLDTPLTTYVSERWIEGDPRFNQITARQVLSHTTGLQNWRSKEDPLRLHFDPGSKWQYSGEGYSYLQLVVAHLTGRVITQSCETMFDGLTVCETDIDAFLKANVLRPFGMTSSGYVWNEVLANRTAAPHDSRGLLLARPRATPILTARYGAAGGLSTTAPDYAKFLIEVLDPKPGDAFRLTRAGRDEMIRPCVKVDDASSFALGWHILHQPKGDLISHAGDNPGFKAFVLASVARKSGYVILTNGDNGFDAMGKLINGETPLNGFVTG